MREFNLTESKRLRDEGVEKVTRPDWQEIALKLLGEVPSGTRGTGEQFGRLLRKMGLPKPHHPNAAGALFLAAQGKKHRLIVKTGELEHMEKRSSHGRLTPVYVRT